MTKVALGFVPGSQFPFLLCERRERTYILTAAELDRRLQNRLGNNTYLWLNNDQEKARVLEFLASDLEAEITADARTFCSTFFLRKWHGLEAAAHLPEFVIAFNKRTGRTRVAGGIADGYQVIYVTLMERVNGFFGTKSVGDGNDIALDISDVKTVEGAAWRFRVVTTGFEVWFQSSGVSVVSEKYARSAHFNMPTLE